MPPRALGPVQYGNFTFLNQFFNPIMPFITFNSSLAYLTKFSKRPKEKKLATFYFSFLIAVFIMLLLFIGMSHWTGMQDHFWPEQETIIIFFSASFIFLSFLYNSFFSNTVDALGLTVHLEKIRILQRIIGALLLVTLFTLGILNIKTFYFYHYLVIGLFIISIVIFLRRRIGVSQSFNSTMNLTKKEIIGYIKEFYQYCLPLFTFSIIILIFGVFSPWFFQKIAGSTQFGYFGLANKVGTVCILFTTSLVTIFMRDTSISWSNKDTRTIRNMVRTYFPMFFSISAIIAMFFSSQSSRVTYLFGGDQFAQGSTAMMIMLFYPIHQTYGQLAGSLYYSMDRTKVYRNIRMTMPFVNTPLFLFLISPEKYHGLNLGAVGYAISSVIGQVISINVLLFFNMRFLGLRYKDFLFHQFYSIGIFFILARFTLKLFDNLVVFKQDFINNIFVFGISGIVYLLLVGMVIFLFPKIVGLERGKLYNTIHGILSKFTKEQ